MYKMPEAEFEKEVIHRLTQYGWEYRHDLDNKSEDELLANWRAILNNNNMPRLHNIPLSDGEFSQLKDQIFRITTPLEAGKLLSTGVLELTRDVKGYENEQVFIEFFWKHDVGAGVNKYEVVRQIRRASLTDGRKDRIFDVTLLISGIPVIHLELKRTGVTVKAAYNQIKEYAEANHFAGFYSLIQIFAILNPEEARYFANPGDYRYFNYDFAFGWNDFKNQPVYEASRFIIDVLSVPMGHKLVSLYTILDDAKSMLKVLRSYQIYAVEAIQNKLYNSRFDGTDRLGGYVWHTTGSGKTVTSFKTAQLISNMPTVDKVVFMADRKELTKQTVEEYKSFADDEGDVIGTANTYKLLDALQKDAGSKLIVTSIQKMKNLADLGAQDKLADKRIVFIVDEAHRSTFGEMMIKIKNSFPTAIWFGFTGTPILDDNKSNDMTTSDIFGDNLHTYSVSDGIRDGNVLAFDVRQNDTKTKRDKRKSVALLKDPGKGELYQQWMDAKQKSDLDVENQIPEANYSCIEHYALVVKDILGKWDDNSSKGRMFSAILTVPSISIANEYFNLLKDNKPGLKVTVIYDDSDRHENDSLDNRLELEKAIKHYNNLFDTKFSLDNVQKYKEDIADRLARKNEYQNLKQEQMLDLIIVVRQLLTGFDAPYINTLYVDKVMDYANLIQAFSRTNRVVGTSKPFGIIEYYRRPEKMKQNIHDAFVLYANKDAAGMMYVDSYKDNIAKVNATYINICTLFPKINDNPDFSNVPKAEEQKQFVKWMNELEQTLIKLRQQGFVWSSPEKVKELVFTESQYFELQARYADLSSGTSGGSSFPRGALEINPVLVSGDTLRIDSEYLTSLLNEFGAKFTNKQQEYTQNKSTEELKQQIHQLFNKLRTNERRFAERILLDIQEGKIQHVESFEKLLDEYKNSAVDASIEKIVQKFGLGKDVFIELLNHHVLGSEDWNDYNRLTKVIESANQDLVRAVIKEEQPDKNINNLYLKTYLTKKIKELIEEILTTR